MPARRTITVSITPEQDALLRTCTQSGRYRSTSEVMRAALRSLERDEVRASNRAKAAAGLQAARD